ncbi:MAG: LemA family protein [Bacteroidales bacterium]|jgi:LemA protein
MPEPEPKDEIVFTKSNVKIGLSLVCILLAVMCIAIPLMTSYNALVNSNIQVTRASANIQTDLERRADLLPNLASEIKGSAKFEHATLVDTIAARAGDASEIRNRIKSTDTSSGTAIDSMQTSDRQLTTLFGGIMTLNEAYPTLQTTEQFKDFEAQTTATENEILVDRQTYNAAVMQYQSIVQSFPTNLVAKQYGFDANRYHMWAPDNQTYADAVPAITFGDMTL